MEREKKIYSGPMLEVDFYPVFADGRRLPERAKKEKPSTEEQKRYNRNQATKKLIRLVNTNFDSTDYFMHPTYLPEKAPQSEERARRDIKNYLERVRYNREITLKKATQQLREAKEAEAQLPYNRHIKASIKVLKEKIKKLKEPFRYVYVIEKQTYKTGLFAGKTNWHFHLFTTGGLDDRTMERLWKNGLRTNCNNYQPEQFGPEAAARYMSKNPQGKKRFSYSKNLKKPKTPQPSDGKISRKGVERLATERVDDRTYWEKRYKGYRFIRCFPRFNNYNNHWYVSVIMYKTDGKPPDWRMEEWQ